MLHDLYYIQAIHNQKLHSICIMHVYIRKTYIND